MTFEKGKLRKNQPGYTASKDTKDNRIKWVPDGSSPEVKAKSKEAAMGLDGLTELSFGTDSYEVKLSPETTMGSEDDFKQRIVEDGVSQIDFDDTDKKIIVMDENWQKSMKATTGSQSESVDRELTDVKLPTAQERINAKLSEAISLLREGTDDPKHLKVIDQAEKEMQKGKYHMASIDLQETAMGLRYFTLAESISMI
jgi:hypothetical protein